MSPAVVVLAIAAMLCATVAWAFASMWLNDRQQRRHYAAMQAARFAEAKRRDDLKRADRVYADAVKRQRALARASSGKRSSKKGDA